jgi:hypothetical protein
MATDRDRTAFHEAGHYVVASAFALNYDDRISITSDGDSLGRVIGESPERIDRPSAERVTAHVVALCAGYVAQRRFDPNQADEDAIAGARSDFEKAAAWADVLTKGDAIEKARAMLNEHWAEVEIVARALLIRNELDAAEADALAILACGDPTAAARAAGVLVHGFGWAPAELSSLTGVAFVG